MNQNEIEVLADKVAKEKHELREALLRRKCNEERRRKNRIVLTKEITLSSEEKRCIIKEAFNAVLGNYSLEDKRLLESLIGKELNRRKQQRKESTQARLASAVAELEKKELTSRDFYAEEVSFIEEQLRREERYKVATELLIQAGRAMRNERGDLIIYNAFGEE